MVTRCYRKCCWAHPGPLCPKAHLFSSCCSVTSAYNSGDFRGQPGLLMTELGRQQPLLLPVPLSSAFPREDRSLASASGRITLLRDDLLSRASQSGQTSPSLRPFPPPPILLQPLTRVFLKKHPLCNLVLLNPCLRLCLAGS